jgi:CheY-like chemotaxis protein
MKILVIEDNPADLRLAKAIFVSDEHTVIQTISGEHALARIAGIKPEIVLIDLKLPGMDGLDVVRKLRAVPRLENVPIVATTAFPDDWTRKAALAAGCTAYLVKPLNTRTLAATVGKMVRRRRAGSSAR